MKPTKGKEKQTTATPEIEKEVDAEAVVKEEADAVADAEKVKEVTKPTGRVRSTKPAGPIHVALCTKIATILGATAVRIQTARTTVPMDKVEVAVVEALAVAAVAAVAAAEDTTTTVVTITKVTIISHEETNTIIKTNKETIIQSRKREELSAK